MNKLKIPDAPNSISKGFPLKFLLGREAITQLAENLHFVYADFNREEFIDDALNDLDPLGIKDRADKIAESMRLFLPQNYSKAVEIILKSLTPPLEETQDNGLAVMFYMPHASFIGKYGVDSKFNNGVDPFETSMNAQYELTKRFTCEYSIRFFLIADEKRTMDVLNSWLNDKDPHIRRLCTEGTRPRLPWAMRIPSFVKDPTPVLPILEKLKDDDDLYVRRSVANHIGDIAKDHLDLALDICERWLKNASKELKWVIRHAVRNPVKKGNQRAIDLRKRAK